MRFKLRSASAASPCYAADSQTAGRIHTHFASAALGREVATLLTIFQPSSNLSSKRYSVTVKRGYLILGSISGSAVVGYWASTLAQAASPVTSTDTMRILFGIGPTLPRGFIT